MQCNHKSLYEGEKGGEIVKTENVWQMLRPLAPKLEGGVTAKEGRGHCLQFKGTNSSHKPPKDVQPGWHLDFQLGLLEQ